MDINKHFTDSMITNSWVELSEGLTGVGGDVGRLLVSLGLDLQLVRGSRLQLIQHAGENISSLLVPSVLDSELVGHQIVRSRLLLRLLPLLSLLPPSDLISLYLLVSSSSTLGAVSSGVQSRQIEGAVLSRCVNGQWYGVQAGRWLRHWDATWDGLILCRSCAAQNLKKKQDRRQ